MLDKILYPQCFPVAEYVTSEMKFYKIKFGAVQSWDIFLFHIFKVTRAMLMKYPTFARVPIYLSHFYELFIVHTI